MKSNKKTDKADFRFSVFTKKDIEKISLVIVFIIPFSLYGCRPLEKTETKITTEDIKEGHGKKISEGSVKKEEGIFRMKKH